MMIVTTLDAPSRPLGRAFLLLVGLGAFFYASYGFSNWFAGTRAAVPSIVFAWERSVPFLDWTIVPYWTTNLFYAASLLFSRTRAELDIHAKRLLTAQLVAILFFLLTPLKFSWPKPETAGFFGFMFEALGAFDKPFNQAPSLHVALTFIIGAQFSRLLPRPAFMAFLAWSVLVVASVMTTFQHHFIDIPTGALLGLFCLWLWRDDSSNGLAGFHLTEDPDRKRLAGYYTAGGLAFALTGLVTGGACLWLLWPALSLWFVALAYLALGPSAFMKAEDGQIGWPARIVLAPYLVGAWFNSRIWTRRDPVATEIADNVFLGRYPDRDTAAGFREIIDLTAEFQRPNAPSRWKSMPMLDLVAPDASLLRKAAIAIEVAQGAQPILVCCALGYGRSAAAIIAWLVMSGRAKDIGTALSMLKKRRPRLAINARQMNAIENAVHG